MYMIDRAALSAALRSAREKIGLTVAQAAERRGCSERQIRRIEDGEAPLDLPTLEDVCKAYQAHPLAVLAAGYRESAELILTGPLPDECKPVLRRVVEAFTK